MTLVELIAALSLTGVALLGAHALLSVLVDAGARVQQDLATREAEATTLATLRDAIAMSEATESGARPFFGDRDGAEFSTRCRVAGGWRERCRVEIQILAKPAGDAVLQFRERNGAWSDALRRSPGSRLAYLEEVDGVRTWRERWGTSIARPLALAIVSDRDTTVVARLP